MDMSMIIPALAAFLTGVCASLGVGGGMILAIYLLTFGGVGQLDAQGINLIFFLPIALISIIMHGRNKLIKWKSVLTLVAVGALGTIGGGLMAHYIKGEILQKGFAVFLLIIGIREVFGAFKKSL